MPMTTEVGGILRHGDHVSKTRWNIAVTSGAEIGLHGLIRLDAAHLYGAVQPVPDALGALLHARNAHATSAMVARAAATTNT